MPKEPEKPSQERTSLADFFLDVRDSFNAFDGMRIRQAPAESVEAANRELAKRVVDFFEQKRKVYLYLGRRGRYSDKPLEVDGEKVSMLCEFGSSYQSIEVEGQDGKTARMQLVNDVCRVNVISASTNYSLDIGEGERGYYIDKMKLKSGDENSAINQEFKLSFKNFED